MNPFDEPVYTDYELVVTRSADHDFHRYVTSATGLNLTDAIAHHNFWCEESDKIGPGWTIIEWKIKAQYTAYPFDLEDAMRKALSAPIDSIHRILQSIKDEQDQLDLIKCIVNESPVQLSSLDTAARDKFCRVMKEG